MVASHRSAITTRTWVIDSGASHNYGNNLRDFRKNAVKETNMIIKLEDGHQIPAKKKGSVRLGGVDIEAFFVPEFRISLLSVGQLDTQGYTTTFRSGICWIADAKGQKVLGANLEDGLYTLSTDGSANISEIRMLRTAPNSHTVNMWHRCLAHLNHQDLRSRLESSGERITDPMDVEQMTNPMDIEPVMYPMDVEPPIVDKPDKPHWETLRLYPTCIYTKQQQHVICTKASWKSSPFELVHSDLCAPMKHSIGGAQYYIIYIDDCTRYTEVYFLITMTAEDISAKFQHYLAWVETQGFHIKRFRSDNGSGEYSNSVFLGLLGEKGITFEPSPAYTQHKNGTAERMIRTLNAKARSMMLDANVPIIFWPEAIRMACYLHRRSPTSSLADTRTPYEALCGTAPKIGHLRRFGCRVYKHIPPVQRMEKKFRNRSCMCIMLGYVHNTTKIWRIWDFKSGITGQAVECSSVVFDEEENAHTKEQTEAIEFSDTTNEAQIEEAQTDKAPQDEIHEVNDTQGRENTSK